MTADTPPEFPAGALDRGCGFTLVLAGGGARGYAHAGVLRALEFHGMRPSALVGVSMGAIVAVTYALREELVPGSAPRPGRAHARSLQPPPRSRRPSRPRAARDPATSRHPGSSPRVGPGGPQRRARSRRARALHPRQATGRGTAARRRRRHRSPDGGASDPSRGRRRRRGLRELSARGDPGAPPSCPRTAGGRRLRRPRAYRRGPRVGSSGGGRRPRSARSHEPGRERPPGDRPRGRDLSPPTRRAPVRRSRSRPATVVPTADRHARVPRAERVRRRGHSSRSREPRRAPRARSPARCVSTDHERKDVGWFIRSSALLHGPHGILDLVAFRGASGPTARSGERTCRPTLTEEAS